MAEPASDDFVYRVGISYECPYGDRVPTCAVIDLMTQPYKDRIAELRTWDEEKQAAVALLARVCSDSRK